MLAGQLKLPWPQQGSDSTFYLVLELGAIFAQKRTFAFSFDGPDWAIIYMSNWRSKLYSGLEAAQSIVAAAVLVNGVIPKALCKMNWR